MFDISSNTSSQSFNPKIYLDNKALKPWYKRKIVYIYSILFLGFYLAIFNWPGGAGPLFSNYGYFFFLGLAGALVANSTGAGGGVIFIPFFAAIGISATESVATSMAIQCFGMTAGAISWLRALPKDHTQANNESFLKELLCVTGFATIIGMLLGQYVFPNPGIEVGSIFRIFSIFFGALLLVYTFVRRKRKATNKNAFNLLEKSAVVITCLLGGIITSWISVGVGECIALLLFFLGCSPKLAVAIGVYTSSISVLTGIIKHVLVFDNVVFEVLLFAGQAALIGGYLARHITQFLGDFYLKLFFGIWILGTGFFME